VDEGPSVIETSHATCCWCHQPLKRVDHGPWWCLTDACYARLQGWAVARQIVEGRSKRLEWLYVPTPPQAMFHDIRMTPELEASIPPRADGRPRRPRINRMYGGAAGPGKSTAERWDLYRKAQLIPGFHGAILRRTNPELEKTHLRAFEQDADKIGAQFITSKNILKWPNGSLVECGHCEDDRAVQKWLSTEYDQIGIDEGSTFEPHMLLEISTRARTTKPAVKAAGGPWFDVVTNPGGPSWALLRDLFVSHSPDYDLYPQLRGRYFPQLWVYSKALLDSNPYLEASYEDDLAVLSEARYRQLRYGEEYVTEGAFFSEWRETVDGKPWHVRDVDTSGAQWFASMDWGYNSPGVVLWWAVLPDGYYHIAYEWKFREQTADEVATRITEITRFLGIERLQYIACDPAMKGRTGAGKGESIFETLLRRRLPMRASDNDRFNGWARVHQFLRESPQGRPWLTVAPICGYGRRTMPALLQDRNNPDDLDTTKDDHWADALRYGAMARPAPFRMEQAEGPPPFLSLAAARLREQRPRGVLA